MMTFVQYFPLMIADIIPADDPVWAFVLNLVEIIDIILCFEVNNSCIDVLRSKIMKLNSDYVLLFADTLKPKFHILTHYPEIIRQSGPVRHLWCFKFESKHRQFKIYSHCITSRKNICLTLSKKYELKFAYQLISTANLNALQFDKKNEKKSNYENIIFDKLVVCSKSCVKFYTKLIYQGIHYECQNIVAMFRDNIDFYVILEIVVNDAETVFLFVQKLNSVNFISHFGAYETDPADLGSFYIISINDIVGPPLTLITTARSKKMIRLKDYYQVIS